MAELSLRGKSNMIVEKELEIENGRLTYSVNKEETAILAGKVYGGRIIVPEFIENLPVTRLGKKAFLSAKMLREIYLPESLSEIEDFAFAYCSGLEKIYLPRREISMGRGVFKGCGSLSAVYPMEGGVCDLQAGSLLGATPIKLEADYLFAPKQAGTKEWLSRFDDKLREFLARPDEDGFVKMVYCGEEDIVANVEYYLLERKREKARLCFLRLLNDRELSTEFRAELSGYLSAHTKGCKSEAAWEVVFKEHGNERAYYMAFTEAGCLTEENYDGILTEMGDSFPEMKGYLMRYRAERMGAEDFFDALSLD
ncbi:MAG: leucine-rich repeat domain-containing protein [Clostridium sp.]|nr:leucine-rich repeat domain-containing protein [Clostridium sp.]